LCDTLVALGNSTKDGSVIIGKNSDREPNECQVIRHFPRAKYPSGSKVRCTYVEIPQVTRTNEVVLSSPYWMWGAEMGANEYGVAIGNETAFSKEPVPKTGLLGMDYIRLGLERATTAREAMEVITSLLEDLGQGGNASAIAQYYYQNTYIIADPHEAWVLETSGRQWAAEKVQDVQGISNGYTIESNGDLSSRDLIEYAKDKGWCKPDDKFSFTRCYSDDAMRSIMSCVERRKRTLMLLREAKGSIDVEMMMKILRDHGENVGSWVPSKPTGWKGSIMGTACMHATPSIVDSTTGSYVGNLTEKLATHWFTGSSYPCISVFIPTFLSGAGSSDIFSRGGSAYDDGSPWWRHEKLARIVQLDYATRAPPIQCEIKMLESEFLLEARKTRQQVLKVSVTDGAKLLRSLTDRSSKKVYDQTSKWTASASKIGNSETSPVDYRNYWIYYNKKVNLQLSA
jgi:secernin